MELDTIVVGDCLDVMAEMPDECIDLIYVDPPYYVQKDFYARDGRFAFGDKWESLEMYLVWLNARLSEMKRLLKPTGSIFVHLDWHASHYVKVELDKIFGYDNFINEIVWCYGSGGASKKRYSRKHDVILFYSKSDKYTFNVDKAREPYSSPHKSATPKVVGEKVYKKMNPLGRIPFDWWQIPILTNSAHERVGYPTQKPTELLQRIIEVSSNPSDVIADFFCGSGTTLVVAKKLKRHFYACDINPACIEIINYRLEKAQLEMAQMEMDLTKF